MLRCVCLPYQEATGGNVLMGLQVESSEMEEFEALADSLGYDYAFDKR